MWLDILCIYKQSHKRTVSFEDIHIIIHIDFIHVHVYMCMFMLAYRTYMYMYMYALELIPKM